MLEEFLRLCLFHDLSLVHENDTICNCFCKLHFMSDNDHRLALLCQIKHNIEYFPHHFRVKCCCNLIK